MLHNKTIFIIVALLLGLTCTQSVFAQTDIFMEVPDIMGESRTQGYEGWIDVVDFNYSVENEQSAAAGRGRSRSRAVVNPVMIGKMGDAASVYLNLATLQGKSFDEVVVEITEGSALKFRYVFTNVVFTSYAHTAHEGENRTEESVGISFENIQVIYFEFDEFGKPIGEHEIEYDVAAGV